MTFIDAVRELWEKVKKAIKQLAEGLRKVFLNRKEKKQGAKLGETPYVPTYQAAGPNIVLPLADYRPSKIAEAIADQELTEPSLPVTEVERELWEEAWDLEEETARKARTYGAVLREKEHDLREAIAAMEPWKKQLTELARKQERLDTEKELQRLEAVLRVTKNSRRRAEIEKRMKVLKNGQ